MPDEKTPWVVKGVPEDTRRKVKVYAAQHDLTMAKAVEELVDSALQGPETALPLSAGPTAANRIFMLWFEWFAASQPALAARIRDYAARRKLSIPATVVILMASGKFFAPNVNPPVLEKFGGLTDEELKNLEDMSALTER